MKKMNRRNFIKGSAMKSLGLLGATMIPISLTACSDESIDMSSLANLGSLDELKKGPFPKKVSYSATIQDAWVEQKQDGFVYVNVDDNGELLIMSPICTHLGCTAGEANAAQKGSGIAIYCPCHGGEYDEYGINIGGPPPRPLDIFKAYIKDNEVLIPILSSQERKA